MFKCNCGKAVCCKSVGHIPELSSTNGVCDQLDTNTNRCKIYDSRPLICRVDDYWEANLQDKITLNDWYKENEEACKKLLSNEIK